MEGTADTAFAWSGEGERRTPSASAPTRRRLITEATLVFLVCLGASTGTAAIELAQELAGVPTGANPFLITLPNNDVVAVAIGCLYLLLRTAGPVALVIYLLRRSGDGLRTIGFSLNIGRDLLLVVVFAVIALRLQAFGFQLPNAANSAGLHFRPEVPAVYAVTGVVRSFEAALVEEFVVLGFLITRLRQAGVHPVIAINLSSVLRSSYHLEYGFAALGPMLFGIGLATLYVGTRRLMPAVVVHAAYDIWVTFQNYTFF